MAECKRCGKKFHACTSCGIMNNWGYEYCSQKCWGESDQYSRVKKSFINFYEGLPNEGMKGMFIEILQLVNDNDYYDTDYKTKELVGEVAIWIKESGAGEPEGD